jgi:predicted nucleic acid-binding protein
LSTLFLDTSALAKRYVVETGSAWLRRQVVPSANNVIIISALTTVEMFSLLARHQREGRLSASTFLRIQRTFLKHVQTEYLKFALDDPLLARARALTTHRPLRALDAIQLATALEAQTTLNMPLTFIGADIRLLTIASAEGLKTHDANAHP